MTKAKWQCTSAELLTLDDPTRVRLASAAANAVLSIWLDKSEAAEPADAPAVAARVVHEWTTTGVIPSNIKTLATLAYSAVSTSALPHGSGKRSAGRAAAHAAFALYFFSRHMSDKVLSATRDAITSAERALRVSPDSFPS